MTARWAVDEVGPRRDLNITWDPISLLFKNEPDEDHPLYAANQFTHRLLRVMQAVNAGEGNEAAHGLYLRYGAVIHHDRADGAIDFDELVDGDATRFLDAAGLPLHYNDAFADESWDANIRERMQIGLDLVGAAVGTPVLGFETAGGLKGVFGPVMSRTTTGETAAEVWDAMVTLATTDGFWELKRTRTEDPHFPERP